ncbi:hypothetical protein T492DRAFT_1061341 [Pavlovales sp. CCMP2436]|nr:hypothetical protein T492DRAFT_1061341 [Pavlovales sp. CCMP2436]|mmetsp:Transcript_33193/g.77941  ORF Transcript_33193/g.77941 Transcript_33193/m.77941 type:complete len:235 (-) Transcript_33193:289-993(-)
MAARLEIFPFAETVRWRGKLLPRYAWYMLSGAVCDVGQFMLYRALWGSSGMATFSWTAAYVLSIALRQEAHKVFVFGHYEGVWYENLWRFYCVYFLTVATSMPVNMLLLRLMKYLPTQVLSLGITDATLAYFGTTIYTGLFSYLRLKANWRKPGSTVKLNRSVLDVSILPTSAGCKPLTKPGAFSKYQATPSEMRERGLMHLVNPCTADGSAKPRHGHTRVPSWGSEYSKLVAI